MDFTLEELQQQKIALGEIITEQVSRIEKMQKQIIILREKLAFIHDHLDDELSDCWIKDISNTLDLVDELEK